jgi:chromosome segregation ATPase
MNSTLLPSQITDPSPRLRRLLELIERLKKERILALDYVEDLEEQYYEIPSSGRLNDEPQALFEQVEEARNELKAKTQDLQQALERYRLRLLW